MIRECLGNKGIEKVFRFDAITCDYIQIRSMNSVSPCSPTGNHRTRPKLQWVVPARFSY